MKRWRRVIALPILAAGLFGFAAQSKKLEVMSDLTTKSVKKEGSNLASLVADAVRSAARAEIALIHAAAFTDNTIPRGSATVEDVLKSLAFRGDSIAVMRLKGDKVKAALEHGLALYPQQHSAFLQVSGLVVTIDSKADKDRRITSLKTSGAEIDSAKVYLVAVPKPLADGTLAFDKIWNRSDTDAERDPKVTLGEAVIKYLDSKSRIGEDNEERLVFKK